MEPLVFIRQEGRHIHSFVTLMNSYVTSGKGLTCYVFLYELTELWWMLYVNFEARAF